MVVFKNLEQVKEIVTGLCARLWLLQRLLEDDSNRFKKITSIWC